jgi:hypothetical protein
MARLISHRTGTALHTPRNFDTAEFLVRALQAVVLTGIALYLAMAIANTILGTGQPDGAYSGPVAGR